MYIRKSSRTYKGKTYSNYASLLYCAPAAITIVRVQRLSTNPV
jgi:hypothetical protein